MKRSLPLTSQGKVDRSTLVESEGAADETVTSEQVHSVVAELVSAAVGEEVGRDDDMFDLGVTSLALVRTLAQLNDRFGISLTGRELGGVASINSLVTAVGKARGFTVAL